jgi:hypothetical protein
MNNFSLKQHLTSKPFFICVALIIITALSLLLAPWISNHIHLSSMQSQLNDLNHQILSNSQQRQELDTQIKSLRAKQSDLSKLNLDIRRQRDALETQIAEQMGLGTGGGLTPSTTTQS